VGGLLDVLGDCLTEHTPSRRCHERRMQLHDLFQACVRQITRNDPGQYETFNRCGGRGENFRRKT
jgi:hypothetical protein